jgi:hypothetical protein
MFFHAVLVVVCTVVVFFVVFGALEFAAGSHFGFGHF